MSGGVAYVLDMDSDLYTKVNKQMVNIEKVTSKFDVSELKGMIEEHVAATNSETGKEILDHFKEYLLQSSFRSCQELQPVHQSYIRIHDHRPLLQLLLLRSYGHRNVRLPHH